MTNNIQSVSIGSPEPTETRFLDMISKGARTVSKQGRGSMRDRGRGRGRGRGGNGKTNVSGVPEKNEPNFS